MRKSHATYVPVTNANDRHLPKGDHYADDSIHFRSDVTLEELIRAGWTIGTSAVTGTPFDVDGDIVLWSPAGSRYFFVNDETGTYIV